MSNNFLLSVFKVKIRVMEDILVPVQQLGGAMDVESEVLLSDIGEAVVFYQLVKDRLLDVNNWDKLCGNSFTTFQLTSGEGTPCSALEEDHFIRIDIPGPGPTIGEGFDWVRVEIILTNSKTEMDQWCGFRVRPCASPFHPEGGVAHFFSDLASSTFMVGRAGHRVYAKMHGRNEVPNKDNEKVIDGIRNTVVAISAKLGFSYPQWKLLVNGLLAKNT